MGKQQRLSEMDDKFKLSLWLQSDSSYFVESPLPQEYGFTVGSNFSTPFDMQGLGENLQKLAAISEISQKLTVNMEKVFINPEPTEISIDLEFDAYYSAKDEVLIPIIRILFMALASQLSFEDAKESIDKMISTISTAGQQVGVTIPEETLKGFLNTSEETDQIAGKAFGFLKLIKSPELVTAKFGNVYTIKNAYISSAAPQFSNVLDPEGIPMSAKCSVTLVLRDVPLKETLPVWFGRSGR